MNLKSGTKRSRKEKNPVAEMVAMEEEEAGLEVAVGSVAIISGKKHNRLPLPS